MVSLSRPAVITVEVWITMPRSVACPLSQRNATTARASCTWWHSVHRRRWRPPQALRTNTRLPRPPAQALRPGPTSAPPKKRSGPARLPWRAPHLPPRSRTHTAAPAPKGGGNTEPFHHVQSSTPHLPRTCEQMGGPKSFTFVLFVVFRF